MAAIIPRAGDKRAWEEGEFILPLQRDPDQPSPKRARVAPAPGGVVEVVQRSLSALGGVGAKVEMVMVDPPENPYMVFEVDRDQGAFVASDFDPSAAGPVACNREREWIKIEFTEMAEPIVVEGELASRAWQRFALLFAEVLSPMARTQMNSPADWMEQAAQYPYEAYAPTEGELTVAKVQVATIDRLWFSNWKRAWQGRKLEVGDRYRSAEGDLAEVEPGRSCRFETYKVGDLVVARGGDTLLRVARVVDNGAASHCFKVSFGSEEEVAQHCLELRPDGIPDWRFGLGRAIHDHLAHKLT